MCLCWQIVTVDHIQFFPVFLKQQTRSCVASQHTLRTEAMMIFFTVIGSECG